MNIFNDDCFASMKNMPAESVDMVLTDPPYGMKFKSNRRKVKYKEIKNDDNLDWLPEFVDEIYRVMKNNTAFYCFCSWHNIDVFKSEIQRKFKIKNIIVWVKNNHGSGDLRGAYGPKHEFIIFAHKGRSLFRNGRRTDVMYADKVPGTKTAHPTEKPIDLLEGFVLDSSDEGGIVFDPFMGSGTTGMAALRNGRDFVGIELDSDMFMIAKSRLDTQTKKVSE